MHYQGDYSLRECITCSVQCIVMFVSLQWPCLQTWINNCNFMTKFDACP